jgi:hypothetical protein
VVAGSELPGGGSVAALPVPAAAPLAAAAGALPAGALPVVAAAGALPVVAAAGALPVAEAGVLPVPEAGVLPVPEAGVLPVPEVVGPLGGDAELPEPWLDEVPGWQLIRDGCGPWHVPALPSMVQAAPSARPMQALRAGSGGRMSAAPLAIIAASASAATSHTVAMRIFPHGALVSAACSSR